jgi:amino acid adenylation domain-containing protein
MAAGALVLDRISGHSACLAGLICASPFGSLTVVNMPCGLIQVPADLSFGHWVASIEQTTTSWRQINQPFEPDAQATPLTIDQIHFAVLDQGFSESNILETIQDLPALVFGVHTRVDQSLSLVIDFDTNVIEANLAEQILKYVSQLLVKLSNLERMPIAQYSFLDFTEIEHLLGNDAFANQTDASPIDVPRAFDAQCARSPLALAISANQIDWTYQQLQVRSIQLAAYFVSSGVKAGDVVAFTLERSPDLYACLIAILRCGAAYMPLDASWPRARIQTMLSQANVKFLIAPVESASDQLSFKDVENLTLAFTGSSEFSPTLSTNSAADSSAYIMFTSGSTGTPKGVMIAQRSILRLVLDANYIELNNSTRMLQAAPLGFDASTLEIWGPLLNGGCCVIHPEAVPTACGLQQTIQSMKVNTAWLTAALFNNIVDQGVEHLAGLEQLAIGGEALSVSHVNRLLQQLPNIRLINGYGPTECTTFSATFKISPEFVASASNIPIGYAINQTTLRVLNARRELVPKGFVGELYIGGQGLAQGYVGNHELTRERFVQDPYGADGVKLYRSGDRVRLLAQGPLEFLGRADQQIKLRGHRIEIGEVEAVLSTMPGVKACAVLVRNDYDASGQLVAYVVTAADQFDPSNWRALMAEQLLAPMLPGAWVRLDALPITRNGKLDRSALPAPSLKRADIAGVSTQAFAVPDDQIELVIAQTFSKILAVESIGALDNFFEFGGSSLAVTQALVMLEKELGVPVAVSTFFGNPTPRAIAKLIRATQGNQANKDNQGALKNKLSTRALNQHEPIAIVGMAARLPGASSIQEFWDNLVQGRDSITHFKDGELDLSIGAALKNDKDYVRARGVIAQADCFDAAFFGISPIEAELMDPQQRVFLELCWECMEHAGHAPVVSGVNDASDPQVGVFAGVYNASYYQNHVLAHPEKIERFGPFQVMLANEKDYVATRVAHRLNLTGPAINVFTACSTSLVAIAQAVDSLRLGRCAAALAGGASITCPTNSGYLYQEGSMLSPDGFTRSFDSQAAGTVFSDGAAVVMLKRLSDAVADRDTIHALIRGVAINNDGAGKASFTAPSVDGQRAVIQSALSDAGISADQVSYVEAHGTATPMGDPIELDALTRAFKASGSAPNQMCYISSAKSNIGHTVMAAGAAGVIKTALALSRELLPKTVHFSHANAQLQLASGPFKVVSQNTLWPRSDIPRIAGVSSFGVGGTNAHIVLQEPPVYLPPKNLAAPPSRFLVKVSAKTQAALLVSINRLKTYLIANPQTRLDDLAYTLDHGRQAFAYRHAMVVGGIDQAIACLDEAQKISLEKLVPARQLDSTVLIFAGQGAQYAQMGMALYGSNPVFAAAMDRCFTALSRRLSFDLKAPLFSVDSDALNQTAVTQPALFSIEYSLAQVWLSLGVKPTALVGHSVGEFVAAALAGVMSLEDAICLVARRGALMQSMAPGKMLAVRMTLEQVQNELTPLLSIASHNGPNAVVVAGPAQQIQAFSDQLLARSIACTTLQTSHAFHSSMMEPVVDQFEKFVQDVELKAPLIPVVSTVTGRWLTTEQATNPRYWADHLRLPVMFSKALGALLEKAEHRFIEIGPSAVLSGMVRQHLNSSAKTLVIASLSGSAAVETKSFETAIADFWSGGGYLSDSQTFGRRIPLPTYPFERRRYWLDAAPAAEKIVEKNKVTEIEIPLNKIKPETIMQTSRQEIINKRRESTIESLRELFESVSGIELAQANPQARFAELGLDSLTLTQVALQLKRQFSIKVTFRELMESYRSLDSLAEHLVSQMPPPQEPLADVDATPALQIVAQSIEKTTDSSAQTAPVASPTATLARQVVAYNAAPERSLAGLSGLFQQQLNLMQQQLDLLRGGAVSAPQVLVGQSALAANAAAHPATQSPAAAPSAVASTAAPANDEETAPKTYDVKKAFGAIARIHTTASSELTSRQRNRLDALVERYVAKTKSSKAFTTEHRDYLADPRVVNGFRPALKEIVYQIVIERSAGAHVWDIDGNRYVDALNGFGMSLFGWQPAFLTDALKKQIDAGYEIGPQHPLAGVVAKQVCEMTGFDRAAFCNTGSEAVMGAVRIARTVTGKHLIVSFTGSYHGIFDEVVVRGTKSLKTIPAAPGIMSNAGDNVLVLEYGTQESLNIIKERADDIAAVLVEPVQSRRPDFQPKEFLQSLRALTLECEIALVFDEIVTGFRTHPGGVQALFGIQADMATYGKVIGGGLSIGVVAGKREYMDALDGGAWQFGDDSIPTVGVTYFAGTFVRHPLALAAAHAVLTHLKEQGPALQQSLSDRTTQMVAQMNVFCVSRGAPIEIRNFCSVWRVVFLEDHPYQDLLFAMMRSRGIHILDNFPCFMTTAHSAQDITLILEAFKDSVTELQEANFIPGHPVQAAVVLDASKPPVAGARLGRNREGQVAWFVESKEVLGQYVEMRLA